ncbi:mce related family protein [Mycobacterium xenopi 3993]|nr:mce related family protein [Mycobacterium xenopi 3993]
MSTIFDVRSLRPPRVSGRTLLVGSLVVVFGLIAAVAGSQLYTQLTTNTVVAYFPETLGLYPGDKVQIMGVRVGAIDKIEPAGDKMRVTFHYRNRYQVPPTPLRRFSTPAWWPPVSSSFHRPTPAGRR